MLTASVIGTAGFLALYLGGGLVSSVISLIGQAKAPKKGVSGSDGASGAIYATLAFFGGLFPQQKFLFFFVIPMPAWLLIGGIFTVSLLGSEGEDTDTTVGSLRHVCPPGLHDRLGGPPGRYACWSCRCHCCTQGHLAPEAVVERARGSKEAATQFICITLTSSSPRVVLQLITSSTTLSLSGTLQRAVWIETD